MSCLAVIRITFVLFNIFFWVIGVSGIALCAWMLFDPSFSMSLTQDPIDYMISLIVILATSLLLVIAVILGIVGVFRKSQCTLTSYFSLLLVIFVAEVVGGLWVYTNRDSLESHVRNAIKMTVENEYGNDKHRQILFDTFQQNLQCCGADSPTDWIGNRQVMVVISREPSVYNIPQSCCKPTAGHEKCFAATHHLKVTSGINYDIVFDQGCTPLIINTLKEHTFCILVAGVTVVFIQILALLFALVITFAIGRSNEYKA